VNKNSCLADAWYPGGEHESDLNNDIKNKVSRFSFTG